MIGPRIVDVGACMHRREMHREFVERPVPREVLERMAWTVVRAQQARSEVRGVILVDDAALIETARHALPGLQTNAPAMMVLYTDTARAVEVTGDRGVDHATRLDSTTACANLSLMAQTFGLGICTSTSWSDSAVRTLFGLPDHVRPDVTVAIGYVSPKAQKAPRGFHTSFYHNRFGTALEKEADND
jgi:nitroreductase